MGNNIKFWIATGGTGGHIFPALAITEELKKLGYKVIISTDSRGKKYIKEKSVFIWASGVGSKKILFQAASIFKIFVSTGALMVRFIFSRPDKIVAFGGYSSVPVLIAGFVFRIPTFLHEQNAAIGRANKFAMPFVKTLMESFPIGVGVLTGLPIRKDFYKTKWQGEKGRLLVTGGSLGAKILDDTLPKAISKLKNIKGIFVIHQTRPENVEKLRKAYADLKIKNNVLFFIKDMAGELSKASLVIGRSGASTVAELQAIGAPAILAPLGINPDQLANAKEFAKNGGGIVIEQKDFNEDNLAKNLDDLLFNQKKLEKMSKLAHKENNAVQNIIKIITA